MRKMKAGFQCFLWLGGDSKRWRGRAGVCVRLAVARPSLLACPWKAGGATGRASGGLRKPSPAADGAGWLPERSVKTGLCFP